MDIGVKRGQLAHIDKNHNNNKEENLAFLCLDHHDSYDGKTSQSKGITSGEIIAAKNALLEFIDAHALEIPNNNSTNLSHSNLLEIRKQLISIKRDRYKASRRVALQELKNILNKLNDGTYEYFEIEIRLLKQIQIESSSKQDLITSSEQVMSAYEKILLLKLDDYEEMDIVLSLSNWVVDLTHYAGGHIGFNKIVKLLNTSINLISKKIGIIEQQNKFKCSLLLALRAKCKRALAKINHDRRYSSSLKDKHLVERIKNDALHDANSAYNYDKNPITKLELALCLFSTSNTTNSENAKTGMSLLLDASNNDNNLLASYELVRQLRMRHEFYDSAILFSRIINKDRKTRRIHENATFFSASIIGLHYQNKLDGDFHRLCMLALELLEETISHGHHTAREVVDLCYMKAIVGLPTGESITSLNMLRPSKDIPWGDLAQLAITLAESPYHKQSLLDGLLLGLDDPAIWGRIGTFFSDFTDNYDEAINFYGYASKIDPQSPVYHFNKARVYANRMKKFDLAKIEMEIVFHLKRNKFGWFSSNESEIVELNSTIHAQLQC